MKTTHKRPSIIGLLISILLMQNVAFAVVNTEIYIPGFVTVKYPSTVSLKFAGCQNINFSYVIDEDLSLENTVWLVQIVHLTKNTIYGGDAWFSNLTYLGKDALPPIPRAGIRSAKICRKTWVEGKGDNKKNVPGIKPGKYRLYFAGVNLDPITGKKLGEKTEVYKTILLK